MDILDTYKKAWENQPEDSQKVSKKEIFKMMYAKSSSIVKWIFIIGLLEFLLNSLFLLFDNSNLKKEYEQLNLYNLMLTIAITLSSISLFFLYKFYTNYKKISSIDNTKQLMNSILKTRKTVRNYVLINISCITIFFITGFIASFYNTTKDLSTYKIGITILILIVICSLLIFLFYLLYQLIYGILLKKLNKNYKELSKLDEL